MVAKRKITPQVSLALDDALLTALSPIITALDQVMDQDGRANVGNHANTGHDLPSRSDKTLAIFLSNLCRDTYQQIYGMPATKTFAGFGGIKNSLDQAENAIAKLVQNYGNNPQDMDADPNFGKFSDWQSQALAKYETLSKILVAFQTVYRTVTGQDWKYVAPGTSQRVVVDKAAAVQRFKDIAAGKAGIGEGSTLVKAS